MALDMDWPGELNSALFPPGSMCRVKCTSEKVNLLLFNIPRVE